MINFIIGVIIAVLAIVAGGFACAQFDDGNTLPGGVYSVVCVLLVIAFIFIPWSIHTVDTGEIAVVKHWGKVTEVKTAGIHYDNWISNKYIKYDSKVQNVDITTAAYSNDAQTMDILMTLQYQIMTDKALDIVNQYGSLNVLENRIISIAIEQTKSVLSSYSAMNIISNRAAVSPAVEKAISDAIGEDYFVKVSAVVLTNIDFSDAFENAVEEKMIAEQNKLKASYENEQKVAKAEADAQSKLIAAKADAEANQLLEKSLTDRVIQIKYLEKWNGILPSVTAGSNGMSLILPDNILG